jgi:predicted amidohydrolase YtcJ
MNPAQPRAEAIAINGEKIVKVGSKAEIGPWIGKNTKVISLEGKTILPGLIDTHIHVVDFARVLTWLDLDNTKSVEELKCIVKKRALQLPKEKWVIGRGWNQTNFAEKRVPNRFDLDEVSPDNPVVLYHQSKQVCIANSKALTLAGIANQTSSPMNNALSKTDAGLTGILRGEATNLVWSRVPEPSERELLDATILAFHEILKAGITSVHWIVLSPIEIPILKKLCSENKLPIRVYLIVPASLIEDVLGSGLCSVSDNTLKVGGGLIFTDGYLAARTAALLKPYSDASAESGKLLCTKEDLTKQAEKIKNANLQLVIHAVGDKAIEATLATLETLRIAGRRDRLEQAAVLNEELTERMKKQRLIVSVQPQVIASEFSVWSAVDHLGFDRAQWLFPIKTLLKNGITVIGGSDCPMEPLNPMVGIQAAVTRDAFPEERIIVDNALRMYTIDAAYGSFEEDIKGSIEVDKLADITVLSADPLSVPAGKIRDITIEMTIIGGRVIYSKS